MFRLRHYANVGLEKAGELVARMFLGLLGLLILASFFCTAFVVSILVGFLTANWIGGGVFTIVVVAFLTALFLSAYVWAPHVKDVVLRACDAIIKG